MIKYLKEFLCKKVGHSTTPIKRNYSMDGVCKEISMCIRCEKMISDKCQLKHCSCCLSHHCSKRYCNCIKCLFKRDMSALWEYNYAEHKLYLARVYKYYINAYGQDTVNKLLLEYDDLANQIESIKNLLPLL